MWTSYIFPMRAKEENRISGEKREGLITERIGEGILSGGLLLFNSRAIGDECVIGAKIGAFNGPTYRCTRCRPASLTMPLSLRDYL